jgi:DNA-binding transcriptional LysR family regulator
VAEDRVVDLVTEGIDVALRTAVGNSEAVVARELGCVCMPRPGTCANKALPPPRLSCTGTKPSPTPRKDPP